MNRRTALSLLGAAAALVAPQTRARAAASAAPAPDAPFGSIDGGTLSLAEFRGGPVLVVNTASLCGFTGQYEGLQALYDRYRDRGLTVLAVPSDDFNQELADEAAVKDFCEVNFGLTFPMTTITRVRGRGAHPLYRWLATEHGFTPRWNFNKVLIGGDGRFLESFGSTVRPDSPRLVRAIEAALAA